MAISSVGIGSGLDVESIITQMIALEKQPIKTLEAKATVIESKISTYGEIKSLTDTLNAAVRDLTLDRTWNTVKISSASSSVANATMTGSAQAGSYNVTVDKLAQSQTSVSAKFGAKETMETAGVIRVKIGNPVLADSMKSYDLEVSANDTLEGLVTKINGHADISKTVIASVITDSNGQQQLMVRSRETGVANQFEFGFFAKATAADVTAASPLSSLLGQELSQEAKDALNALADGVEVTEEQAELLPMLKAGQVITSADLAKWSAWTADGYQLTQADVDAHSTLALNDLITATTGGLGKMAYVDPNADAQTPNHGFQTTQAAQNAVIKLNGVELTSNSNSFADTIPGLSINVSEAGKSTLLTVTQDKDAIQTSIQKFVDAYNALNDMLVKTTSGTRTADGAVDDAAVKAGKGLLQGDSSTVSLQNALRLLTQGIASEAKGAFTRLSDAGIQMQQGGKLKVDSTKLSTALNDMESLKAMFATKADSLGNGGGIAVNFKSFTDELLAYEGTLNNKTDSLEKQLKLNGKEQDKVETRAETVEARLRKQYSALDVKMASISSLSSYVEQMVASWNKSKD